MTKKEKLLLISSIVMLLAGTGIFLYKRNSGSAYNEGRLPVELKTFQVGGGWGYDIRVGRDFAIHQDRIPAIPGNKPFINEAEALKAGRFIVEKLKKGKIPSFTLAELDDLHIHY
jgi:hypothetical protein